MTLDFLSSNNAVFVEELYSRYLSNRSSVDPTWAEYFDSIKSDGAIAGASWGTKPHVIGAKEDVVSTDQKSQSKVDIKSVQNAVSDNYFKAKFLVGGYRERGHYLANIDPLGIEPKLSKSDIDLNPEHEGFDVSDMTKIVNLKKEYFGLQECTLGEFIALLDNTYARNIGFEFAHLQNSEEKDWLYAQIERRSIEFDVDTQKQLLQGLVEVESFEQYLHVKFPGAKRFSIEGLESSIVALQRVVEHTADHGVHDIVIGMAHRGRLATLSQVMGKPYRALLSEFMGTSYIPKDLSVAGDVKYHVGYSSDHITRAGNKIHLSLAYNPSHLEAVNPVVAGKVRAQQDRTGDVQRKKVVGVVIHGDAAFCGQGVVAESLSLSGLKAYEVGGILHIITNNQVGFTANPEDQHTGRYATEVAKVVNAPIIHINAEDIESVIFATDIALQYRHRFGKDIVLDIVGYRKYGHNEGDEPAYTQPVMYSIIKNKETHAAIYSKALTAKGVIDAEYYPKIKAEFKKKLDDEYVAAKTYKPKAQWLEGLWSGLTASESQGNIVTGVDAATLKELGLKLCAIPADFDANPKLIKLFEQRAGDLKSGTQIDWATGEQLAFATLLSEGMPIRLTGEDTGRGTFSHRHSVLHSQSGNGKFIPLNALSEKYAKYEVADSNLSEYAVLGFEYGYSLVNPMHLVLWEAQYGDFVNGAQIVIDQFLASGETKWLRLSGLVLLLPHGFEGSGPEHSSARLERFLQLCACDNMRVVNPTTPASFFHLLRRQIHSNSRKPLIVMTPKSMLRHKLAVSSLAEMGVGTSFKPVIDEVDSKIKNVKRVIICSGKVYYDLVEARISR